MSACSGEKCSLIIKSDVPKAPINCHRLGLDAGIVFEHTVPTMKAHFYALDNNPSLHPIKGGDAEGWIVELDAARRRLATSSGQVRSRTLADRDAGGGSCPMHQTWGTKDQAPGFPNSVRRRISSFPAGGAS